MFQKTKQRNDQSRDPAKALFPFRTRLYPAAGGNGKENEFSMTQSNQGPQIAIPVPWNELFLAVIRGTQAPCAYFPSGRTPKPTRHTSPGRICAQEFNEAGEREGVGEDDRGDIIGHVHPSGYETRKQFCLTLRLYMIARSTNHSSFNAFPGNHFFVSATNAECLSKEE